MHDQKKFAIIGVGGYIAGKHLKAIKDTGNNLLASLDPADSVGIIDSYFPDCHFFVEFERFDRHIDKLRRSGIQTDYVSICSRTTFMIPISGLPFVRAPMPYAKSRWYSIPGILKH